MPINFRVLMADDLSEWRRWFGDAELFRRVAFPDGSWWNHVSIDPGACSWLAWSRGQALAQVQVDRDADGCGWISLAVRPDRRGQGLGSQVLAAFLAGPGRDYPRLCGCIEPDNLASLACFRRCGFEVGAKPDDEGFFHAVFPPGMPGHDLASCD